MKMKGLLTTAALLVQAVSAIRVPVGYVVPATYKHGIGYPKPNAPSKTTMSPVFPVFAVPTPSTSSTSSTPLTTPTPSSLLAHHIHSTTTPRPVWSAGGAHNWNTTSPYQTAAVNSPFYQPWASVSSPAASASRFSQPSVANSTKSWNATSTGYLDVPTTKVTHSTKWVTKTIGYGSGENGYTTTVSPVVYPVTETGILRVNAPQVTGGTNSTGQASWTVVHLTKTFKCDACVGGSTAVSYPTLLPATNTGGGLPSTAVYSAGVPASASTGFETVTMPCAGCAGGMNTLVITAPLQTSAVRQGAGNISQGTTQPVYSAAVSSVSPVTVVASRIVTVPCEACPGGLTMNLEYGVSLSTPMVTATQSGFTTLRTSVVRQEAGYVSQASAQSRLGAAIASASPIAVVVTKTVTADCQSCPGGVTTSLEYGVPTSTPTVAGVQSPITTLPAGSAATSTPQQVSVGTSSVSPVTIVVSQTVTVACASCPGGVSTSMVYSASAAGQSTTGASTQPTGGVVSSQVAAQSLSRAVSIQVAAHPSSIAVSSQGAVQPLGSAVLNQGTTQSVNGAVSSQGAATLISGTVLSQGTAQSSSGAMSDQGAAQPSASAASSLGATQSSNVTISVPYPTGIEFSNDAVAGSSGGNAFVGLVMFAVAAVVLL